MSVHEGLDALLSQADASARVNDWQTALTHYAAARGLCEADACVSDPFREGRARLGEATALHGLGRGDQEIAALQAAVARFSALQPERPVYRSTPERGLAPVAAQAAVRLAEAIRNTHGAEQALLAYEQVALRFSDTSETEALRWVATARFARSQLLGELARHNAELTALDEILAKFDTGAAARETELGWWVAASWVNRGEVLQSLGRTEAGIACCREFAKRFETTQDAAIKLLVMTATHNMAAAMAAHGQTTEALSAVDDLLAHYAGRDDQPCPAPIQAAYATKAWCLGLLKRPEDAIAAYDQLISRCERSEDADTMVQVAHALFEKGRAQLQSYHRSAAFDTFRHLIKRYGGIDNQQLAARVAEARSLAAGLGELDKDDDAPYRERKAQRSKDLRLWFGGSMAFAVVAVAVALGLSALVAVLLYVYLR